MNARSSFADDFDFHGVRIAVRSDDARTVAMLRSRLRRFAAPAAGAADVSFSYTHSAGPRHFAPLPATARPVYDAPVGAVLYDDPTDRMIIDWDARHRSIADMTDGSVHTVLGSTGPDECWMAAHPFFTLAFLEQLKRRDLFGVHAALLVRGGRGLLVPGGSGAGKSTLTLCLLRAGFDFGGDDLCFLVRRGAELRVLAFPDELDVAETTLDFFPELRFLRARPRRPGAHKWPLLPEEIYPVRFAEECTPAVLVFPQIGGDDRSSVEPLDPASAMLELVPNVLLTHAARSQAHLDALGGLVARSSCWRLRTGRDFDAIPGMLAHLLDADAGRVA